MSFIQVRVLAVVVFIFCVGISHVLGNCRSGWMAHESSCYYFSIDTESWHGAQSACDHYESFLAEINNYYEDAFLHRWIRIMGGNNYWLGGNELENPGEWRWASTDRLFTYTNWVPGEPNLYHGEPEHCLEWNEYEGGWNDNSCPKLFRYICEQDAGGQIIG